MQDRTAVVDTFDHELGGCDEWGTLSRSRSFSSIGDHLTQLARYKIDAEVLVLIPRWAVWLARSVDEVGVRAAKTNLAIDIAVSDGLEWVARSPTRADFAMRARAYVTAFSVGYFGATRDLIASTTSFDAPHRTWRKRWY